MEDDWRTPDWFYREHETFNAWGSDANELTVENIHELIKAVDTGNGELPIQKVLERLPQLWLGHDRTGHGTFVFPQKRLGSQFVPDFLIAVGSSAGMDWRLVELEAPMHIPHLKNGDPSVKLRKAISQINDWRRWLTDNISYAVRPKAENGLGLWNISPRSPATVYIGRRPFSSDFNAERRRLREEQGITVSSYDALIESAAFELARFQGVGRDGAERFVAELRLDN